MMTIELAPDDNGANPPPRQQMFLLVVFMNLFRAMTGAYALSMLGTFVLRETVGERWTGMMAINEMVHLGVLPALMLLPICLLLRRWGLVLLLAPTVAVCLGWYGPHFLSAEDIAAPAPDEITLSVMTYNIAGLNNVNRDWRQIEAEIRAADPDIVALQELNPDAAAYLSDALADLYPEQVLHPAGGATGAGVFSRYPVLAETHLVPTFTEQRLEIAVDGTTLVLYNAHPPPPSFGFEPRNDEIIDLLVRAADETPETPVIIVGDFNTTPNSEIYARIREDYRDAWDQVGRGFGFTFGLAGFNLPLARIDYVFHNQHLRVLSADTGAYGGSDHRPVWASLAMQMYE